MKDRAAGVNFPHHLEHIFKIERFPKKVMAHGTPGGIRDLAILQVEARGRKSIEIARVIIMQMREDNVGDFIRIDIEQSKRVHRTAQMFALAPNGRLLRESGVDHEATIAAARHPDEVVEIRPVFVWIGQNETLSRMAIS